MESRSSFKRNSISLIILATLLLACNLSRSRPAGPGSSSNNNSGASPGTGGAQPSAGFHPAGDARQNLRDAFSRLKTAYPYRLTETVTSAGNSQQPMPPTVRVAEFAAADRIQTKLNGQDLTITFGDKHYNYVNGKWVETSIAPKRSEANMENFLASSVKDVQSVGNETVNGVQCFAYTTRLEWTVSNQPSIGNAKIWIGLADGLPHQLDGDWKIANYDSKSHIIYEYNVDIKIEKPVP
jgi:hypothetical protein